MADLEPVEPSAILPRAGSVVARGRGSTSLSARGRALVASGRRALAAAPVLPASVLAVAVVATARTVGRLARAAGVDAPPVRSEAVGPPLRGPVRGVTLQVAWTYVEVRSLR